MKLYAVKPAQTVVVLTGHDDGYLTALDLAEAGVTVKAVVDMRPVASDTSLLSAVKTKGIPCHLSSTVYEAYTAVACST